MWVAVIALLGSVVTNICGDVNVFAPTTPPMIMEEFRDLPASFGGAIPDDGLRGLLVQADPADGCEPLAKPPVESNNNTNWIVLIARYNCSFEVKVRNAQLAGYDCAIVHNVNSSDLETMSAKNAKDILIPSVFVGGFAGATLANGYLYNSGYYIMVNGDLPFNINTSLLLPFAIVVVICLIVILIFMIMKCVNDRRRERRHRLPSRSLKKIPTCKFSKGDPYDTCAICLDDYQEGERLRVLPCAHAYHAKCIDPWLTQNRRVCPCCKRKVLAVGERPTHASDSESDDTAPLVNSGPEQPTQGGTFEPQRENPFVRAARFMRRLRRRPPEEAQQEPDDSVGATPTEENEQPNNNVNDENAPEDDTAPLLATSSSSVVVEEVSRRRRRSRRRPRSAGPARSVPQPTAIPHHSINTDTVQGSPQERGEIGVAALPASQDPPNVLYI